jgi:ABC-2 type transport system permease protein
MYANPFTYPALAPKQLLFGDTALVVAGIAYDAVFAVGMVALAVRLFGSDRVVTGDAGRLSDVFSSLQR